MIYDTIKLLPDIKNVFVFVADSLRYDHLPDSVSRKGISAKTVAPSLATYMSMPSIITGLSPRHHGVQRWGDKIPTQQDFLHDPDVDTAYSGQADDVHHEMVRMDDARDVTELKSPWFCYVHSYLSHLPYETDSLSDFIHETAGNDDRIRELYQIGVERVVEKFFDLYEDVEERGEVNETLFVFTSDHGEYLGEHGLVGHSSPLRPEGVYVPTVFIHPNLPDTEADGIVRSIDIYPTALGATGKAIPEWVDGCDLFSRQPEYGHTDSLAKLNNNIPVWDAMSVWDADGGYVKVNSNLVKRFGTVLGKCLEPSGWQPRHIRKKPGVIGPLSRHYLKGWQTYDSPRISANRAQQLIAEYRTQTPIKPEREGLSPDQRNHLQELGYL